MLEYTNSLSKLHTLRLELLEPKYYYTMKYLYNIPYITIKNFNINNFNFHIRNKLFTCSTYFVSPYCIDSKLLNFINISFNKKNLMNDMLLKIFSKNIILFDYEIVILEKYITRSLLTSKPFLNTSTVFLLIWYLITQDPYIKNKKSLLSCLKKLYKKIYNNKFNITDLLKILFKSTDNDSYKIYLMLYILLEEFHYKYIQLVLGKYHNKKMFLSFNYTRINPLNYLNNYNNKCQTIINDIIDDVKFPFAHNTLLVIINNKVFYYDSDIIVSNDYYKLKLILNNSNFSLFNISTRNPIQTINDDCNCLFYCIRIANIICNKMTAILHPLLVKSVPEMSLRHLQKIAYTSELVHFSQKNMRQWILQLSNNIFI